MFNIVCVTCADMTNVKNNSYFQNKNDSICPDEVLKENLKKPSQLGKSHFYKLKNMKLPVANYTLIYKHNVRQRGSPLIIGQLWRWKYFESILSHVVSLGLKSQQLPAHCCSSAHEAPVLSSFFLYGSWVLSKCAPNPEQPVAKLNRSPVVYSVYFLDCHLKENKEGCWLKKSETSSMKTANSKRKISWHVKAVCTE